MNFFRILTITLISFLAFNAPAADKKGATVTFEKTSHDFGNIKEANGAVTTTFKFVNDGDAPLVILSARASCGCTTPSYPKRPVAPGAEGNITVTFDPQARPGEFVKDVVVKTNDKKHKRLTLRLTGVVIPGK